MHPKEKSNSTIISALQGINLYTIFHGISFGSKPPSIAFPVSSPHSTGLMTTCPIMASGIALSNRSGSIQCDRHIRMKTQLL